MKKYITDLKISSPLTQEKSEHLLGRIFEMAERRQEKEKLSGLKAEEIQLESYYNNLAEWRKVVASIREDEMKNKKQMFGN